MEGRVYEAALIDGEIITKLGSNETIMQNPLDKGEWSYGRGLRALAKFSGNPLYFFYQAVNSVKCGPIGGGNGQGLFGLFEHGPEF